jgi:serine/threonine protein kinase
MRAGPDNVADDKALTGLAPTFRPTVEAVGGRPDGLPRPGQRVGDFELLRVLGRGSFATVFLARQVSLGRPVALKVTADFGSEARTLARLEHDRIVQVFSEGVASGLRLLCTQYVAGTTLERVLDALKGRLRPQRGAGRC